MVKTLFKVLIGILVFAILAVGGFMVAISIQHTKSRREITQLVSEIRPGMLFGEVVSRLGRESQTFTNATDIEIHGSTKDQNIVTNSTLHLFSHNTVPMRWICVYTDRDSRTVIYASWKDI